ncbi:MAG: Ig-like domain-containing protein [Bacteroidota bacterium]|nr:Ig-like domain-containing protein [Bacteroidota bacterium]
MKKIVLLLTPLLAALAWNCRDNSNNITGSVVDSPIDDPYTTPYVIWTDPLDGAVGPNIMSPGNVVKIRFDKLMDSKSVVRAVSLSPSSEWVYVDTTRSGPVEGTTFDFPLIPEPNYLPIVRDAKLDALFPSWYVIQYPYFKVGQTYTISVSASASDMFGNTLDQPDSFSFTPEPYFRITDTTPLDNDTAVSPLATIAVRFNAMIDTLSVRNAFSVSPAIATGSSYFSSWGLYWSPSPKFASETQYTVNISTQAKDRDGHQLHAPFSFSFITGK